MSNIVKFAFKKPQASANISIGGEVYPVDALSNSIEVPLEVAERLVANNLGKVISEAATPTNEGAGAATSEDTSKEVLKNLLKKTVPELQALATESGLSEEEWAELTKPNLVNYLIEKAFNTPE